MATTSAPYGLRPINSLGGRPFAASTRMIRIPSGYAVNLFNGDPVLIVDTGATRGTVARFTATVAQGTVTSAVTSVGVFLGCQYTDATFGMLQRQYWPASTVASDALAFVYDDPDGLFQVQANGSVAQTALGCNFPLIQTAVGSTTTGNSGVGIQASANATTATLPIRLVDFVNAPGSAIGDTYTDCIVRINTHFNRTAAGTQAA